MDLKKLEELIRLFEQSNLSEIEVEEDGRRMRLQKALPPAYPPNYPFPQHQVGPIPVPQSLPPAAPESATTPTVEEALPPGLITIDSPMVGTFYAAPAPGDPAFVSIGDRVEEGATICIVEAMKLMNEVAAKFPCTVERILVENGEPVEFGQPLFAVRRL